MAAPAAQAAMGVQLVAAALAAGGVLLAAPAAQAAIGVQRDSMMI